MEEGNAGCEGTRGRTRREFLGALCLGAVGAASAAAAVAPAPASNAAAPPLPWQYRKLDAEEAGRRAYRFYHEKGG